METPYAGMLADRRLACGDRTASIKLVRKHAIRDTLEIKAVPGQAVALVHLDADGEPDLALEGGVGNEHDLAHLSARTQARDKAKFLDVIKCEAATRIQ